MGAFVWKRGDSSSSASAHAAPGPAQTLQQHTSSNGVTATTLVPPPCSRQQPEKLLPGHSQHSCQNGQPSLKRKQDVLQPGEQQPIQPGIHSCPHHDHQHKRLRTSKGANSVNAPNAPPTSGSQQPHAAPHSQPPSSAQPGQPPPPFKQGPSHPKPIPQQHHYHPRHQPQRPTAPTAAHRSTSQQQQGPGVPPSPLQRSHQEGHVPPRAEASISPQVPNTSRAAHRPAHAHPPHQVPTPRLPHAHTPHQPLPHRPPGTHQQQHPPHRPPHAQQQRPPQHNSATGRPDDAAPQHKRGQTPESTPHGKLSVHVSQ
eukprot:1157473-Pelagomonas_calceolata.AAC.3